jgi:molybdopterin biosynthesis enzyme
MSSYRITSTTAFAVALVAETLHANPASATLGAPYVSVEADRVHMSAHHAVASQAGYTVHSLTTASGSVVREFTRSDGRVFAVAWQGPARPDLRQALGPYFDELNAANPPRTRGGRHIPLTANQADLVVRSGGHSGGFFGVAYVPGLVPTGVSVATLR